MQNNHSLPFVNSNAEWITVAKSEMRGLPLQDTTDHFHSAADSRRGLLRILQSFAGSIRQL